MVTIVTRHIWWGLLSVTLTYDLLANPSNYIPDTTTSHNFHVYNTGLLYLPLIAMAAHLPPLPPYNLFSAQQPDGYCKNINQTMLQLCLKHQQQPFSPRVKTKVFKTAHKDQSALPKTFLALSLTSITLLQPLGPPWCSYNMPGILHKNVSSLECCPSTNCMYEKLPFSLEEIVQKSLLHRGLHS